MDEGSDSRFWPSFINLFRSKNGAPVEDAIMEAQEDGELAAEEASMLLNVLTLDEHRVQDIMVPRPDIVCAETGASVQEIAHLCVETGHSRIPLYDGTRDNIVGVVFAKDLLAYLLDPTETAPPLTQIMREPFFVPETKNALEMFREFRVRKTHLAIVVDEYGGTSGLVTLEDVIEEVVGEIEDEYDAPRPEDIVLMKDGSLLVNGRTELDILQERLGIDLSSDNVETIGGYLSDLAGRVPEKGECFEVEGLAFAINAADHKSVQSISIRPVGTGRTEAVPTEGEVAPEGETGGADGAEPQPDTLNAANQ